MGTAHYRLWLLAAAGTLLDGFSIGALGLALPLVIPQMGIDAAMVGFVGAAIVLGAGIGAALGGPAGDRWGRRRLMLADMALIAVGALVGTLAPGPMMLLLGQLLVGVGIGMDFPVGGAYVSEMMPRKYRGRMMVATIACQSIGMMLAVGLALALLSNGGNLDRWRFLVGGVGAVAAVFLMARVRLPESVRWLMSQGRNADAAIAIARVIPGKQAQALNLATAAGAAVHHVALVAAREAPPGFRTLFSRPYIARTILVSVPWFLMDIATYGVGLFTPVILGAVHLEGGRSGPVAQDFASARGSGVIDLFLLLGFLAGLWLVPTFGRIRMQVVGFAGMAVGMLLLLGSTSLPSDSDLRVPVVFAGFVVFNLLMNAGPNATTFTLAPELFPTHLRGSAGGFAAGFAKAGATLGVFVLPVVKGALGIPAVLGLMAAVSLLGLTVTALFGHEVSEGLPLEGQQRG